MARTYQEVFKELENNTYQFIYDEDGNFNFTKWTTDDIANALMENDIEVNKENIIKVIEELAYQSQDHIMEDMDVWIKETAYGLKQNGGI